MLLSFSSLCTLFFFYSLYFHTLTFRFFFLLPLSSLTPFFLIGSLLVVPFFVHSLLPSTERFCFTFPHTAHSFTLMLWLTRTHSERAHTNFDTSFTGAALFPLSGSLTLALLRRFSFLPSTNHYTNTRTHTHTLGPKKGTRLHCSLQLRRCVHFRHTIFPGVRRGDFRATNPRALFRARTGSRTLPKCRKCEPRPRRRTVFRGIVPTGRNGPLFRDTHNL